MADVDFDFFDEGPPPPSRGTTTRFDSGTGERIGPSKSDASPRQSERVKSSGPSRRSLGASEDQVEVVEARGSSIYEHDSHDLRDEKRVGWGDQDDEDATYYVQDRPKTSHTVSNHRASRPSTGVQKKYNRGDKYSDSESSSASDKSFSSASSSASSRSSRSEKRREKPRSAFRSRSRSHSTSSWSSATDVSPMQSPERSPPKPDRTYSDYLRPKTRGKGRHYSTDSTSYDQVSSKEDDGLDLKHILESILDLERQRHEEGLGAPSLPRANARPKSGKKSYSFSDARVETIDKENQRLLQKILNLQQQNRPEKKKPKKTSDPPLARLHHTAINRQREQRQIEMENQRILQRLSTVRPTPGMKREEQLSTHWRQSTYGVPRFAIRAAQAPDPDALYDSVHGTTSVKVGLAPRPVSAKRPSRPASAVPARTRPWSAASSAGSSVSSRARIRPRSAKADVQYRMYRETQWNDRW